MADAILSRFGYADYWDYLLDPSPMGLIGAQDIINMYEDPQFALCPVTSVMEPAI